MRTLNPAAPPLDEADDAARRVLFPLIFETLVVPDRTGGLHGLLAENWESNAETTEWRFRLRAGVRLHDGTPLDSARIAAALIAREPAWQIAAHTGSITIRVPEAIPDLPWLLADGRYAIAFGRSGGGEPIGSGPFGIERWEPRRLRLRAHETHWQGRAFVDAIQVEMARPGAEQVGSIELGRADIVGISVQDVRRVSNRGLRIVSSAPRELFALVISPDPSASAIREALTHAIDRQAMWTALLQRHGEPATGVLPGWISGYQQVMSTPPDRARSRSIVGSLPPAHRQIALRLTGADPLVRSIAERVVVDGRDVGLTIDISGAYASGQVRTPQMQLMRFAIQATTPERAFSTIAQKLGVPFALDARSLDAVYRAERALLAHAVIVPLAHVPDLYAAAPHVESWNAPIVEPWGAWNLADVWLKAGAP
jgi:ABC-type transport system substrate-binding protein